MSLSQFLMIIAAILFFLGAINVPRANWLCAGFGAWALAIAFGGATLHL